MIVHFFYKRDQRLLLCKHCFNSICMISSIPPSIHPSVLWASDSNQGSGAHPDTHSTKGGETAWPGLLDQKTLWEQVPLFQNKETGDGFPGPPNFYCSPVSSNRLSRGRQRAWTYRATCDKARLLILPGVFIVLTAIPNSIILFLRYLISKPGLFTSLLIAFFFFLHSYSNILLLIFFVYYTLYCCIQIYYHPVFLTKKPQQYSKQGSPSV